MPTTESSGGRSALPWFLLSLAALYGPLAVQLFLDQEQWDSDQLSAWILATPGMSLVVLLHQWDLLPGDWEQRIYLGIGVALTSLVILFLLLLCGKSRPSQIAAVVFSLGIGIASAWVNWTLQRSW